jgi:hypothetical protein
MILRLGHFDLLYPRSSLPALADGVVTGNEVGPVTDAAVVTSPVRLAVTQPKDGPASRVFCGPDSTTSPSPPYDEEQQQMCTALTVGFVWGCFFLAFFF